MNLMDTASRIGFDTKRHGKCHDGVRNRIERNGPVGSIRNSARSGSGPLERMGSRGNHEYEATHSRHSR